MAAASPPIPAWDYTAPNVPWNAAATLVGHLLVVPSRALQIKGRLLGRAGPGRASCPM